MGSLASGPVEAARRPRAQYADEAPQKKLGALPVAAEFCRRLGVREIVDRQCPMREVATARVTPGQVVEALIANRLTSPSPMVGIVDWARDFAVEEVYGIPAAALNDDKVIRTLDAVAESRERIASEVAMAAIDAFGIDVSRIHWDMTSMSLYGDYDAVYEAYPIPDYGHPKDRRTDLKQIQAGLAAAADGGIPFWHNVFSGNAAEVNQIVDTLATLQRVARRRDLLVLGDSKLISYGNVVAMNGAGVRFIAALGAARVDNSLYASLDLAKATMVDYVAQRDEKKRDKKPEQVGVYRVLEDTMDLAGPRKNSDPVQHCRRVLVHSTGNAAAQAKTRTNKLNRAREELDNLVRLAGSRYYPDQQAVAAKVGVIATKRRVQAYLHTTITTNEAGKPTLAWHYDQAAIDADAAADGWYALLTNIPTDQESAANILIQYKAQPVVERRYSDFKGPLAVAPLFLHRNDRIAALITVICLALLIFCLIEREARNNLAPETEIVGFYAYDNRAVKPTGRLILAALAHLQLVPAHDGKAAQVIRPGYLQNRLLDLLRVDPTRPRWLTK
jgi:transposase